MTISRAAQETSHLLEFLLNAQQRVTHARMLALGMSEARRQAEELCRLLPPLRRLGEWFLGEKPVCVPQAIPDADFFKLMRPNAAQQASTRTSSQESTHTSSQEGLVAGAVVINEFTVATHWSDFVTGLSAQQHGVSAIFLPPGFDSQAALASAPAPGMGTALTDFLKNHQEKSLAANHHRLLLRTGVLSHEFEIYESLLLGFGGLVMHAAHLDHFELQYHTEICRDLKMHLILLADSESTLEKILLTDAPYIGIWAYSALDFSSHWRVLQGLAPRIPSTCLKFAFHPEPVGAGAQGATQALLGASGYTAIFS